MSQKRHWMWNDKTALENLVQSAEETGDTGKVPRLQQEHKETQADPKVDNTRHGGGWASYFDIVRLYELIVPCDRQK